MAQFGNEALKAFLSQSAVHGRTVVDLEHNIFTGVTPVDEFGGEYPDLTIKGACSSSPLISVSRNEPNGVRVHGMLDASVFPRVIKVSKALRGSGVLTEWPILAARPKRIKHELYHKDMGLQAFRECIHDYLACCARVNGAIASELPMPVGVVGDIGQKLTEMQFGVMYRGMITNRRLSELQLFRYERGELDVLVEDILKQLDKRAENDPELAEVMSRAKGHYGTENYLLSTLPKILGLNLGRLRRLGGAHKYLNKGNLTLAGEIVDLDSLLLPSVFPEDSDDVKPELFSNDFRMLLNGLTESIFMFLNGPNNYKDAPVYVRAAIEAACRYFTSAYIDAIAGVDLNPVETAIFKYYLTHFSTHEIDDLSVVRKRKPLALNSEQIPVVIEYARRAFEICETGSYSSEEEYYEQIGHVIRKVYKFSCLLVNVFFEQNGYDPARSKQVAEHIAEHDAEYCISLHFADNIPTWAGDNSKADIVGP